MSDWVILRTAGRSTLPLADSLSRAGIEAWSPSAPAIGSQKPAPLTPTYVFARSGHLLDLMRLAANPGTAHVGFSVMHRPQGIPLVRDAALSGLRSEEESAWPKEVERKPRWNRGKPLEIGREVKVANVKGFEGMEGVVEGSDERRTVIAFGGWMTLEIETWILSPDDVGSDQPTFGRAA